ncbi:hypothetical protein ACWD5F_39290 [Streptomyces sp. NPDC002499]
MIVDAGFAAVLGALAGAAATTGAGLVTGWAARQQTRTTARVEHRKLLMEPRRQAYRQFIAAAMAFLEHHELVITTRRVDAAFADEAARLAEAVKEGWVSVALAGPKDAEKWAAAFRKECREHARALAYFTDPTANTPDDHWPELYGTWMELGDRMSAFISAVQLTLDDDGSV